MGACGECSSACACDRVARPLQPQRQRIAECETSAPRRRQPRSSVRGKSQHRHADRVAAGVTAEGAGYKVLPLPHTQLPPPSAATQCGETPYARPCAPRARTQCNRHRRTHTRANTLGPAALIYMAHYQTERAREVAWQQRKHERSREGASSVHKRTLQATAARSRTGKQHAQTRLGN
jgi:hypothetical protein